MVGQGLEWFQVKGFEGGTTLAHFKGFMRMYGDTWGHAGHVKIFRLEI